MTTFIVIAAVMAAIAAAIVAVPLLRSKNSRLLGAVAAVLVAGAAAGLYPLWSNWSWQPPAETNAGQAPDVLAMVAKLEQHLKEQPSDREGWLMMGRSYMALERPGDAVIAYQHAYDLDKGADASLALAEALSVKAGGEITPQAAQLFEEALKTEPQNPKALFYGGFAAAIRGDRALARERWQALKALHPPKQIEQMLDARIEELGPEQGAAALAGTTPSSGGTNASPSGSAPAEVAVNISVAPALQARVTRDAPLFVFAREPGGAGPPLAAKRLSTAAIGTKISLSASDSMIPGRVLRIGQKVSVTARVSFSGQPTPAAGDLFGEAAAEVGSGGTLNLVIDRVAQ